MNQVVISRLRLKLLLFDIFNCKVGIYLDLCNTKVYKLPIVAH